MSARGLTWVFVACAVGAGHAVQTPLTPPAVNEAVVIGQSGIERERTAFHAPYRLPVNRAPVDFIEVITPFRRVVLVAEQLARSGNRAFSQRQALERPDIREEEIELRVELTFHPLNTYVAVPAFDVTLAGPGGVRLEPRTFDRTPRYTPRIDARPGVLPVPGGLVFPDTSQPILGGTVSARFDLRPMKATGAYEAIVSEGGQELARAALDLARLR